MLLKLTNATSRFDLDGNQHYDPVFVVAAKIVDIRTDLLSGETLIVYDHGENVLVKESQEEVARMLVKAMRPPIMDYPGDPPLDLSRVKDCEHVTVVSTRRDPGCPDCGAMFLGMHRPDCPRINAPKLD